ncbi:hypothetical protein DSCW_64670 [Desulfosarcina widdelii]|uniref:Uncharacterized protein n=1 Tax=Desulfosarcina widdelii TaxID=947919 RepID=A0A5K7ZDZ6_9BACT|nr:hypothetical protein DSCW_64670 [Desulfosarcina widdelii]
MQYPIPSQFRTAVSSLTIFKQIPPVLWRSVYLFLVCLSIAGGLESLAEYSSVAVKLFIRGIKIDTQP